VVDGEAEDGTIGASDTKQVAGATGHCERGLRPEIKLDDLAARTGELVVFGAVANLSTCTATSEREWRPREDETQRPTA
jgi:hypothetical protein